MKNNTFSKMLKLLKPKRKSLIIIFILAVIINIGEVVKPYIIKIVIDDYLSLEIWEKAGMTIGILGAIYISIVLLGSILDFIITTATSMIGEEILYNIRNKLFKYSMKSNILFHDKTPSGTLFVRTTSDVEDISNFFKDVVTTFAKDIIMIIALLTMMFTIDYRLALVCLGLIPFVIITTYLTNKISKKVREYSKKVKTNLNIFMAESIYGVKLIKLFNKQRIKEKEYSKICDEFYKSRMPIAITEGLIVAFMVIFENLGVSLIVWICINNLFSISLDVGVIYMFITYLKQIFAPIQRIVENFEIIQEAIISVDKIFNILEKDEYIEDFDTGIIPKKIEGKIEFKHVWFAYKNNEWVLKDVSFTINPGESIAIVGRTGSGKTTIINLINRFYDIQKGEILIDGINIKDINLKFLRQNIGIVLQEPFIFANNIEENIKMNQKITDNEVDLAINLASADLFVNSLPKGKKEIAHERGESFSAGEKQLIAYARIFAKNPAIFILDEATANIDTKNEELIQKSVDKISKEKTSIFIAHRLSTIVNVDKIIVLSHGKIIEQGSHNELLKIPNGYYYKLYNSYYQNLSV